MEEKPNSDIQPKIDFTPEQFGLDINDRSDLDIYVQSSGDMLIAGQLLAKRDLESRHRAGEVADDIYAIRLDRLEKQIVQRRSELGLFG